MSGALFLSQFPKNKIKNLIVLLLTYSFLAIIFFSFHILKILWCLICHVWCAQHVNRLEITPDKHYLAAAGNPHIRLFDVNSNSPQPVRCFHNWSYFYLSKKNQNSFCTFLNSLLHIFFHSLMWTLVFDGMAGDELWFTY